jgi:hypothetical protein
MTPISSEPTAGSEAGGLKAIWGAFPAICEYLKSGRFPLLRGIVLLLCIFCAIGVDEKHIQHILLPYLANVPIVGSYISELTYVGKWEFFSLLATLIITWAYWALQMKNHADIDAPLLSAGNFCLGSAVSLLFVALCTIRSAATGTHWMFVHLVSVCLVAILFFFDDLFSWHGTGRRQINLQQKYDELTKTLTNASAGKAECTEEVKTLRSILEEQHKQLGKTMKDIAAHKTEFLYSLIAADVPMCVALLCLLLFLVVHPLEHTFQVVASCTNCEAQCGLVDPKFMNSEMGFWESHEYFVGGAIAFQFLVSTTVYVLLEAGFLKKATEP